ncbi:MAG: beta-propeller domain-containing protein [Acholeplasmatales bacterium]|jgi:uncharacterized secreted protein with C-terminal beta-propeller domain|nr:beta-propeller domain-containing protein [Acholeplasmatales bacterium]
MYYLGVLLVILSITGVAILLAIWIRNLVWNKKLNKYKQKNGISVSHAYNPFGIKKVLIGALSVFIIFLSFNMIYVNTPLKYSSNTKLNSVGTINNLKTMIDRNKELPIFGVTMYSTLEAPTDSIYYADKTPSYSTTNTIVSGVDEGDVIKTNGRFVVYIHSDQREINVFDVYKDTYTLRQIEDQTFAPSSLYLYNNKLIAFGTTIVNNSSGTDGSYHFIRYYQNNSEVRIYDLETLDLEYKLESESSFIESRLFEDTLVIVAANYSFYEYNNDDYNNPTFKIPKYTITKNGVSTTYELDLNKVFSINGYNGFSLLASLDLRDYSYEYIGFLESTNQIYINSSSIYILGSNYYYNRLFIDTIGLFDSDYNNYTRIIKLDIKDNKITYSANTILEGSVNDCFWMDEYNGYFRVVVSTYNRDNNWRYTYKLYVLKQKGEEFQVTGLISEGIGKPNETIKAVKFNKDICQIVTYETKDPLYTIDLSSPTKPFIKDNPIEEPGYSTYIHYFDDTHLIGIGLDSKNNLKISAYDTSSDTPLQTYSFSGTGDYTYSEAMYNYKAILVDTELGIIGIPVYGFGTSEENGFIWGSYYQIFNIDFNSSTDIITVKAVIGDTFDNNDSDNNYYWSDSPRTVRIDEYYYVLSLGNIYIYNSISDTTVSSLVPFKLAINYYYYYFDLK